MSNEIEILRTDVINYIKTFLGGNLIDVELEAKDYNVAIDRALARYRQRSRNSVEESYGFLTLQTDQNDYILPKEVMEVRQLFRRSIGSRSGGGDGGTLFEPFNLAYSNTYLLSSSNMGGLATYYIFSSYQNLVGKMFGSFIDFTFNSTTKKLTIMQRPRGEESVLIQMYNYRPDINLFQDTYAGIWIKDYALANCKLILGEAREKFGNVPGPQGGVTLNGTAMKSEATASMERLDLELTNNFDNSSPLYWVRG
jgi:hypothetical protein